VVAEDRDDAACVAAIGRRVRDGVRACVDRAIGLRAVGGPGVLGGAIVGQRTVDVRKGGIGGACVQPGRARVGGWAGMVGAVDAGYRGGREDDREGPPLDLLHLQDGHCTRRAHGASRAKAFAARTSLHEACIACTSCVSPSLRRPSTPRRAGAAPRRRAP
jgi:hypothetical protein